MALYDIVLMKHEELISLSKSRESGEVNHVTMFWYIT